MILVTGGTGFLGRALVAELVKRGKKVRVLSRRKVEVPGAEVVLGDVADLAAVRKAVDGCNIVFHLAASLDYFVAEKELDNVNVLGSRNVMEACLGAGVKRVVYASSVAVEGVTRYGRSKKRAEDAVMEYADRIEVVALRFAAIYGPGSKQMVILMDNVVQGRIGMVGKDYQNHLVDIRNCIGALVRGLEGKPGVWTIADPEPIMAERMYEIVRDGLGAKDKRIPKWVFFSVAALAEMVWRLRGKKLGVNLDFYRTLMLERDYDIGPAVEEFGYKPKVRTEQGLKDLVKWYLGSPAKGGQAN